MTLLSRSVAGPAGVGGLDEPLVTMAGQLSSPHPGHDPRTGLLGLTTQLGRHGEHAASHRGDDRPFRHPGTAQGHAGSQGPGGLGGSPQTGGDDVGREQVRIGGMDTTGDRGDESPQHLRSHS